MAPPDPDEPTSYTSHALPSGTSYTSHALPSGTVYHIWAPPSAAHAVLLLQHGYAEYAERYVQHHSGLIPRLVALGLEVWALDLRGHGRSPGARGAVHVAKAVADHLALRSRIAPRPVVLFGHSLGGLVTAASVAADAGGVRGVVLTGPALPEPGPRVGRVLLGGVARVVPKKEIMGVRAAPVEELTRDEAEVRAFMRDPLIVKRRIMFLTAVTALRAAKTVWDGVEGWRVPTLVLHGTEDTATQYRQSQKLVERIQSLDKKLVTIEGGRHETLNDIGKEEYVGLVMDWIQKTIKPALQESTKGLP